MVQDRSSEGTKAAQTSRAYAQRREALALPCFGLGSLRAAEIWEVFVSRVGGHPLSLSSSHEMSRTDLAQVTRAGPSLLSQRPLMAEGRS